MKYLEAVASLEARVGMPVHRAPSLAPMIQALGELQQQCPELRWSAAKTILVAGTNGKGSTCATLEALLLAAQVGRVGLYTSPHLEEYTERIRLDGKQVSQAHFAALLAGLAARVDCSRLSCFEMLTLMAVWAFYGPQDDDAAAAFCLPPVEWGIFEVGLGGTWDATNAIAHEVAVIAPLGFDHQNLLGHTLNEIAGNKFGIIRPLSGSQVDKTTGGMRVISAPLPPEVLPLARQVQAATGSHWSFAPPACWEVRQGPGEKEHKVGETAAQRQPFTTVSGQVSVQMPQDPRDPCFILHSPWGQAELALVGARAAQNAMLALATFQALGFDPSSQLAALKSVVWPGRMERVLPESLLLPCPLYCSGDHNPAGVQSLIELLEAYAYRTLWLLVGVTAQKDLAGILEPLLQVRGAKVVLTEPPFQPRKLASYPQALRERAVGLEADPLTALQGMARQAGPEDLILVTGSLYLVGFLKKALKKPDPLAKID